MTENSASGHNLEPHELKARISERVDQTMRAVTLLIDQGEEAVALQGGDSIDNLYGAGDKVDSTNEAGALLYWSVDPVEMGGPVLAQVYEKLGAVEARIAAVPTVEEIPALGEFPKELISLTYTFAIKGVTLTEKQDMETGQPTYYLYGSKKQQ